MQARTLEELIDEADPGWPVVQEWIAEATNPVEVLPSVEAERGAELLRIQVTTRSPMGALAYESGGLLVDHGWLRILGSGHPRLPRALGSWNEERTGSAGLAGMLFIADDVVGGFFALNGGALPGAPGSVFYFSPHSVEWEDLGVSYSQFLVWALTGDLAAFYADSRWEGWVEDVQVLDGADGFTIYPPLVAEGPPVGERHRGVVPVREL